MEYIKLKNELEVIENLQKVLEKISNDSIREKGAFYVGFSGNFQIKKNKNKIL